MGFRLAALFQQTCAVDLAKAVVSLPIDLRAIKLDDLRLLLPELRSPPVYRQKLANTTISLKQSFIFSERP